MTWWGHLVAESRVSAQADVTQFHKSVNWPCSFPWCCAYKTFLVVCTHSIVIFRPKDPSCPLTKVQKKTKGLMCLFRFSTFRFRFGRAGCRMSSPWPTGYLDVHPIPWQATLRWVSSPSRQDIAATWMSAPGLQPAKEGFRECCLFSLIHLFIHSLTA